MFTRLTFKHRLMVVNDSWTYYVVYVLLPYNHRVIIWSLVLCVLCIYVWRVYMAYTGFFRGSSGTYCYCVVVIANRLRIRKLLVLKALVILISRARYTCLYRLRLYQHINMENVLHVNFKMHITYAKYNYFEKSTCLIRYHLHF